MNLGLTHADQEFVEKSSKIVLPGAPHFSFVFDYRFCWIWQAN